MEEQKEYSVFDEVREQKHSSLVANVHGLLYYVFVGYFIIKALLRWGYFTAFRSFAVAHNEAPVNIANLPYLVSALSITIIIVSSLVLFFRNSLRGAIGMLILGALMELVFYYFMKTY